MYIKLEGPSRVEVKGLSFSESPFFFKRKWVPERRFLLLCVNTGVNKDCMFAKVKSPKTHEIPR